MKEGIFSYFLFLQSFLQIFNDSFNFSIEKTWNILDKYLIFLVNGEFLCAKVHPAPGVNRIRYGLIGNFLIGLFNFDIREVFAAGWIFQILGSQIVVQKIVFVLLIFIV